MIAELPVVITVRREVVADELLECCDDVRAMIGLIPSSRRHIAVAIAQRMHARMKGWITAEPGAIEVRPNDGARIIPHPAYDHDDDEFVPDN